MTGTCLASIWHYENHNCIPGAKKNCSSLLCLFNNYFHMAPACNDHSGECFVSQFAFCVYFNLVFIFVFHSCSLCVRVYSVDCISYVWMEKITGRSHERIFSGKMFERKREKLNSGTQAAWSHHHSTSRTMH